jgi:hypothetical protein
MAYLSSRVLPFALVACAPLIASAQEQGDEAPRAERTFLEGGGVRVGDSLVLHPRFELSTGYNSNVYSQDDTDNFNTGAAVIRLGAGALLQTTSAPKGDVENADVPQEETARPKVAFRGDAFLFWNQFISGDSSVIKASDLGAQLLAELKINPLGQLVFSVRDVFQRLVRPGQASQDVDHDYNDLGANLLYRPGGGALSFSGQYNFVLDIFENSQVSTANRITHKFALNARWQWLPKTDFTLQTSLWIVDPLDDVRPGAMPLRIWLGTNTLITPVFGVVLRAGYGNSFYTTGPNFSSYLALVEMRYGPNPAMNFAAGYSHDFADAYIGSFYVDHAFYLRYTMQIGGRWQLGAKGEVKLRSYEGIVDPAGIDFCGNAACENTRFDLVLRAELFGEYQINTWLFASVLYALNDVTTDFFIRTPSGADSAGYVAHELFAKVSAKF